MLATELIHLFLNSPELAGKAKRNYEKPVFNRLLQMNTGDVPYQLLLQQDRKGHPLEIFEAFLFENGYADTAIEKDLIDLNAKHRLTQLYKDYLDNKGDHYYHYVLAAVNKYLLALEDLPEWLVDIRIFDYLKNEPSRKTYGKAVGEFLTDANAVSELASFLESKRVPVQEHRERFFPSKEKPVRLTADQYKRLFETSELLEHVMLLLTLVDGVKLDDLLVSTVNHFAENEGKLNGVQISANTVTALTKYIKASFKRGKELLFPTPKPLLVKYARRAAARAGLPEEFHNMMGLRQVISNGIES